eukprot:355115-Chlamydomonas_euryale.AAC.2
MLRRLGAAVARRTACTPASGTAASIHIAPGGAGHVATPAAAAAETKRRAASCAIADATPGPATAASSS